MGVAIVKVKNCEDWEGWEEDRGGCIMPPCKGGDVLKEISPEPEMRS